MRLASGIYLTFPDSKQGCHIRGSSWATPDDEVYGKAIAIDLDKP